MSDANSAGIDTGPGPHGGAGAPTFDEPVGEHWALWANGTMCPAGEVGAMLRSPCAFSDDFQWLPVMSDDDVPALRLPRQRERSFLLNVPGRFVVMPRNGAIAECFRDCLTANVVSCKHVMREAAALPCIPDSGMIIPAMGTKSDPIAAFAPDAAADVLFTPVQQRLLGLLFGQPQRRFQSAELIRLASAGTGAVHRLLKRLAGAGLITVESVGNQKFYQANPDAPVFDELCGLVRKTVGLVGPLQDALAPVADRIRLAFVYGSMAKGGGHAGSDIDLMVIADDLDYAALYALLPAVEAALARPVNPNLMTTAEWQRKSEQEDSFAARIRAQPKLFLIGAGDDLD